MWLVREAIAHYFGWRAEAGDPVSLELSLNHSARRPFRSAKTMSRLLAIVAIVMLLGGAGAGILAMAGPRPRGNSSPLLASPPGAPAPPSDASPPPVFDIPKLDKVTVDGNAADWGDRGLRVNALANTTG